MGLDPWLGRTDVTGAVAETQTTPTALPRPLSLSRPSERADVEPEAAEKLSRVFNSHFSHPDFFFFIIPSEVHLERR